MGGGLLLVGASLLLLSHSLAEAACPCVTTPWKYNGAWIITLDIKFRYLIQMKCTGDSFSYCANPTGAKTDWCPTQLNADGSYTSDLPFSWCEAEVGTQENNDNNEATIYKYTYHSAGVHSV